MNGELRHLTYLVSHANAIQLMGGQPHLLGDGKEVHAYISEVLFCRPLLDSPLLNRLGSIGFKRESPADWFARLQNHCDLKLSLIRVAAAPIELRREVLASFATCGLWAIEVIHESGVEYWRADWTHIEQPIIENQVWRLDYKKDKSFLPLHLAEYSIAEAQQKLISALCESESFAYRVGQDKWAAYFSKSRTVIKEGADKLTNWETRGLLPESIYPVGSRLLLEAAARSDVFGGMGSWNDIVLESEELMSQYHSISRTLFETYNDAIVTVVNGGFRLGPEEVPGPEKVSGTP